MVQFPEGKQISLGWSLGCGFECLVVAIVLNATVAHGHGKAVFFGLFVTAFITRTFQDSLGQTKVLAFLGGVAVFHVLLVFLIPNDSQYAGGLLAPAGIADIALFYFLARSLMRTSKPDAHG